MDFNQNNNASDLKSFFDNMDFSVTWDSPPDTGGSSDTLSLPDTTIDFSSDYSRVAAMQAQADSLNWDFLDSVPDGELDPEAAIDAFDSLKQSAEPVMDSVAAYVRLFDFEYLSGGGDCPAFINQSHVIPLAGTNGVSFSFRQLCEWRMGGLTVFGVARIFLRLLVSFACMMMIFRAVTRSSNSGVSDED